MAKINGRPFLFYLLDQIDQAGIKRVVVCTGYMAFQIEERVGHAHKRLRVDYSREETPLGTAGALKLAGKNVDTEYCLVMNGDSYAEFDLVSLLTTHKKSSARITMVYKEIEDSTRYGTIRMVDNQTIIAFTEKGMVTGPALINTGVYMVNTSVLQETSDTTPCSLEYDFFPSMIGKGIHGHETKGNFIDIGTPESYEQAKSFFS
jgi:NDP-sugar pyrophosphorylase family protein